MSRAREIIESTVQFRGKLLEVVVDRVRLPGGGEGVREILRHPGAVAVVPVADDGRVLLVRQHRHPIGRELLEVPAGKLDDPGEDPEGCARRELEEETGCRAATFERLAVYYSSPGFTDERIHLFLATGVEAVAPPPATDGDEPIATEWLELGDALDALYDGRIEDGKSIAGIALAALRLGRQAASGERAP